MAHRGGPGWPGRGPRLYRPDNSISYGPLPGRGGIRAAGVPRGFRGPPMPPMHRPRPPATPLSPPHPPVVNYRHRGDELSAGSGREEILNREKFDYGHGRDRSRSPYASRESQHGSKVVHAHLLCSVVFADCVAFCLDRILFEKLTEK